MTKTKIKFFNGLFEVPVPEDVDEKILINNMKDINLEWVGSKGNKLYFKLIEEKKNYYKPTMNYKNYYNNKDLVGRTNIFDMIGECIKTSRGSIIIKERNDNDINVLMDYADSLKQVILELNFKRREYE